MMLALNILAKMFFVVVVFLVDLIFGLSIFIYCGVVSVITEDPK